MLKKNLLKLHQKILRNNLTKKVKDIYEKYKTLIK